jgi:hypothetical protein
MKNWFKNKIAALTFAFSNVEKNILNQDGKTADNGTNQERRHLQGTLADSLVHGEVTQEVKNLRWRTYKILKSSDKTSLEFDYIDENGNIYYKTKRNDEKAILKKIKLDEYDEYDLEMVILNNEITIGTYDAITKYFKEYETPVESINDNNDNVVSHGEISSKEYFATNKTDKPINITRDCTPTFFIENFTKKINVRKIDENKKLLEFYVSKYPDEYNKNSKFFIKEIQKLITAGPRNISFLDINEIEFITNKTLGATDFLHYSFKVLNFDKIIEFDGNYVIKFNCETLIDGENILLKYVEPELEEKYDKKESKKTTNG